MKQLLWRSPALVRGSVRIARRAQAVNHHLRSCSSNSGSKSDVWDYGLDLSSRSEKRKNVKFVGQYRSPMNPKDLWNKVTKKQNVPRETDMLIVGGGVMGLATAYFLLKDNPNAYKVTVVEKDPTYSKAATALSVGGIRQQFSLPENIKMSMFGAEFLRDIRSNLKVEGMDPPDIQFNPQGYLFLATAKGEETLVENYYTQVDLDAAVELMDQNRLKAKFPWLTTSDLAVGSYGLANEGWFDPWLYLAALKSKCASLGVTFVQGTVNEFVVDEEPGRGYFMVNGKQKIRQTVNRIVVEDEDGDLHGLQFAVVVNAAGPWAGEVAKLAKVGTEESGPLSFALPVEPRKRYVFMIHCPDGPGLEMPMMIDPTGVYCRREGLGGHYICGASPTEEEGEPDISNLDVDYDVFYERIWPVLAHRVPAFECVKDQDPGINDDVIPEYFHEHVYPILKHRIPVFKNLELKNAWAGYYDYNTYDQNLIIGNHPYYRNMYFCNGSSGHGIQHAAAAGRAVSEMIVENDFITIDLSRFSFDRIMDEEPIFEKNIV